MKKTKKIGSILVILVVLASLFSCSDTPVPASWQVVYEGGGGLSFRGISAVDDMVCWVSGSQGTVLRTTDGGENWQDVSIEGADSLDFRDIHAFGPDTAVAMSIGSGDQSRLYRTENGGSTWSLVHQNTHPDGFYDAISFWDGRHGVLQGDPLEGRLYILRTEDGGRTWQENGREAMPQVEDGEYAFAASGSHLITMPDGHAWIGTGGVRSRILHSDDYGQTWSSIPSQIIQGEPSTGIFSLVFGDNSFALAVGGDYTKEQEGTDNVIFSDDGGDSWHLHPGEGLEFRSSIQYADGVFLTAGPSGSDYSPDRGSTWTSIPGPGFHALSIGSSGLRSAWAAGAAGRIAKLVLDSGS